MEIFKRIKCLIGFHGCCCEVWGCNKATHAWDGCKCNLCETIRDEGHTWGGCKCNLCGTTRDEGHIWDGCKCSLCGTTRDEGHAWDRCRCIRCGVSNDDNAVHAWNTCDCSRGAHVICTYCGVITTKHSDRIDIRKLFGCPKCKYAISKNLVAYPGGWATCMLMALVANEELMRLKAGGNMKLLHNTGSILNEHYGTSGMIIVWESILKISERHFGESLDESCAIVLASWKNIGDWHKALFKDGIRGYRWNE